MGSLAFGTVGSPNSTPARPGGSVGAIQQISTLGLNALELGWVQSVRVSEETCRNIAAESKKLDVHVSVHASYYINLNADDEKWPASRQRLMDACYFGFLAGATDIVFHPGSSFGLGPEIVLPAVIHRLEDISSELRERGIGVTLRPETMGKSALLGSLDDVLEMSRNVPGVLPCLDFAHLHAREGNGSMNTTAEWRSIFEKTGAVLGESALQHMHIHLSGIEYTSKGERKHLPIRESDFNYLDLFAALREFGCSGRLLCESPNLEEDALYLQSVWNSLEA